MKNVEQWDDALAAKGDMGQGYPQGEGRVPRQDQRQKGKPNLSLFIFCSSAVITKGEKNTKPLFKRS